MAAVPERAGRNALGGLQSALREQWPERDDGWVQADDLHLTLRYLGDLSAERLEAALSSLRLTEDEPSLALRCTGIELWPSIRPRIAVARFEEDPRISRWVATIETWAVENGLQPEQRPYAAHVTLLRSPRPLPALQASPAADISVCFTSVAAMHRSQAVRGPRYEAHAEYRLA